MSDQTALAIAITSSSIQSQATRPCQEKIAEIPQIQAQTPQNLKNHESTPKWYKLMHLYMYVIVGGFDTIATNYQNTTVIDGVRFNHPFIQTFLMFFGMSFTMVWVAYMKISGKPLLQHDPKKKELKCFRDYALIFLPTVLDSCGSTFQFFAQMLVASSVYQMMRGGSIVFTTILSRLLFRRLTLWYRYAGLTFVVVGLTLVGISNTLGPIEYTGEQLPTPFYAYILLLLCMLFNAGLYTSEEYIYSKYNIHPCQLLGIESLYGIVLFSIVLFFINEQDCFLPNEKNCVVVDGRKVNESIGLFVTQVMSDWSLALFIFIGLMTKLIYGWNGVSTTHYFNSMVRSVAGTLRSLVVWSVGIVVTSYVPSRQWENLAWEVNLVKSIGYSGLLFGNLVYNQVVKLPYFKIEPSSPNQLPQQTIKQQAIELPCNLVERELLQPNGQQIQRQVASETRVGREDGVLT